MTKGSNSSNRLLRIETSSTLNNLRGFRSYLTKEAMLSKGIVKPEADATVNKGAKVSNGVFWGDGLMACFIVWKSEVE